MVHAKLRFPSRVLGRFTEVSVLLPKPQSLFTDANASLEISRKRNLLFFHGVGDDADAVLLHTDMAALCDALDIVVILPSVENSFCLDLGSGRCWRTYLVDELLPYIQRIFSLSAARQDRLIGGISMGGYGACSIALSLPEHFSRVVCLSGALELRTASRYARACGISLPETLMDPQAMEAHPEWDLGALAERAAKSITAPAFYLACSEMDSVYKTNLRFHACAEKAGLRIALHTAPGLHDWNFWRENLPTALEWAVCADD